MDILATFFNLLGAFLIIKRRPIKLSRCGFISHGLASIFWILWSLSLNNTGGWLIGTQTVFFGLNVFGWWHWGKMNEN